MGDVRRLRRLLEQKLTLNAELRKNFLAAVEQQLAEVDVLRAALRPMTVSDAVRGRQSAVPLAPCTARTKALHQPRCLPRCASPAACYPALTP